MTEIISSLQNPRVKQAARLRDRRQRDKQGRFLIDGARELRRAIAAGIQPETIFVCRPLCHSDESRELLDSLASHPAVVHVSPEVFAKLAFGDRAEGLLGVASTPTHRLEALALPANPLLAVLEGVEKPGNLGAVLRSADGAGLSALILADARADLYNPNAIRASLGTLFSMPLAAASSSETLAWLRQQNVQILTARVDAPSLYTAVDLRRPSALVLGSEATGLTGIWRAPDTVPIRLPMQGQADSLNISAAAAILFYESHRQRTQRPGA